MKPLILKNGRGEVLFCPTGALRMMFDGRGLIYELSEAERLRLSLALWDSVPEATRKALRAK